jgi:hypothetical protein
VLHRLMLQNFQTLLWPQVCQEAVVVKGMERWQGEPRCQTWPIRRFLELQVQQLRCQMHPMALQPFVSRLLPAVSSHPTGSPAEWQQLPLHPRPRCYKSRMATNGLFINLNYSMES